MESDFIKSVNIEPFTGTDTQYHALQDSISVSMLKKVKTSPAHYKYAEPTKETEAMIFGSAYHCFVLEPERFETEYFVLDDTDIINTLLGKYKAPKMTNDYKAWVGEQMSSAGDRKIISKEDFQKVQDMKENLFSHPYAKMLLTKGTPEQGLLGTIETMVGPIQIKLKPDYVKEQKHIIVDLKTAVDASFDGFTRSAAKLDYHLQAAFYSDILEQMTGHPYSFYFIAQEKETPYAFSIFECSPQFIAQGRFEVEQLLMLYKHCLDTDEWPDYGTWCENKYKIFQLTLPPYEIKDINWYDHKIA